MRNKLIAKIHIAQNQMRLEEQIYRGLLLRVTGKNSCKKMTMIELSNVLNELKRLGFRPVKRKADKRPTPTADREKYLQKITAQLTTLKLPQAYADKMAKQAFNIDFVHWLSPYQLQKIIQMLAMYQLRQQRKTHNDNK